MYFRCGNVAAILELDEHLQRDFTIFEAAPQVSIVSSHCCLFFVGIKKNEQNNNNNKQKIISQLMLGRSFELFVFLLQESRGIPSKKPQADYFL